MLSIVLFDVQVVTCGKGMVGRGGESLLPRMHVTGPRECEQPAPGRHHGSWKFLTAAPPLSVFTIVLE
ncbi:hypothetical protein J6590_031612 [Homalodisca vitripennis]|nr:hypothetical protein J6590_031612 [Homalodisca vitripennis]